MKKALIIYSENSHDIFLVSLLQSIRNEDIFVVCYLSQEKLIRINQYLKTEIEIDCFIENNVVFVPLNFLNSSRINKFTPYFLSSLLNKVMKVFFFSIFYFHGLKNLDYLLIGISNYDFICLENYFPLSSFIIKRLLKHHKPFLKKKSIVIHNTEKTTHLTSNNVFFNSFLICSNDLINNIHPNQLSLTKRIPFSITNNKLIQRRFVSYNPDKSQIILLVVIGEISKHRRDYKNIFESLKYIPKNKYELFLLGSISDKSIIEYGYSLGLNLKVFDGYVTQTEFDDVMIKMDFIIYKSSVKKNYFVTKAPGVVYDSMRYGVPIITFDNIKIEFSHAPKIHFIDDDRKLTYGNLIDLRNYNNKLTRTNMIKNLHNLEKQMINSAIFTD